MAPGTVHGRVDREGRLVAADPPLAELQARAGGVPAGTLAVPQLARMARITRQLGIPIARPVRTADGERDVELFVRAEPEGEDIRLAIGGWVAVAARQPASALGRMRSADLRRAIAGAEPGGEPADGFGERLSNALRAPIDRIIAEAEGIGELPEGALRWDYLDYSGDITSAARHLRSLVDDLVDLDAIDRPDFSPDSRPIDLAEVARRAAGLLAVRAGDRAITVERPAPDAVVPAWGEFRRVLQILVNLLGNALRHSPEGGTIVIAAEREGDLAAVMVADQGRGIAAEDQERVFERFVRIGPVEGTGSGLGLYIARRLARAMGGDLGLVSAPGEGARFILTLPAG